MWGLLDSRAPGGANVAPAAPKEEAPTAHAQNTLEELVAIQAEQKLSIMVYDSTFCTD